MQQRGSVAIVGIGGIFPDAPDLDSFWENIRLAKSASREVAPGKWRVPVDSVFSDEKGAPDKVYSRRACLIDALPPSSELKGLALDPALLDGLDPLFHLLLHAGNRAFHDAVHSPVDRSRVGVIIGNLALPTESSALLARDFLGRSFQEKLLGRSTPRQSKNALNRYVAGLPAGLLAHALGLGGGSYTLDAACASSLYAIKLAVDELLSGRADAMLTGGVSRPDPLYTQMGFSQLRALSRRGICSPFDAAGDGLVVGEGAGLFLLKRTEDAVAHGDRIYGVIRGIGLSNDVGGSLLAPISEGQLRAMRGAYAQAGWQPQDVDLVECHAAGTQVGDATEFGSLQSLWNGASPAGERCVIGSVKSNIGHLLTAAGAAALTKVLLAMGKETLPPTANFSVPPAAIALQESPFQVLKSERPWQRRNSGTPRRAAVSAFGFGGINAHLLVEEYLPQESSAAVPVRSAKPCDVAIVGLDARFGSHHSLREFQERVLGGGEVKPAHPADWWGAQESAWFREEGLKEGGCRGHFVDEVTVAADEFRIAPREMEEMLPQQLLMLESAAAAMADAGLGREKKLKCGVFVGIALDLNSTNFSLRWTLPEEAQGWAEDLGLHLSAEEMKAWTANLQDTLSPPLTANRTMGALGSIVASRIAREFRMGGPSFTLSNDEGSGIRALESAVRMLQAGELDRALVGAVDLAGDVRALLGHHEIRPLSASGTARPFDEQANGSIAGEGAAALVLKRLEDAQADGDRIYAVVKGIGSAGGKVLLPGEEAYAHALERAYRDAQVDPATVSLVEAHGSGNLDEDRMEAKALARFYGGSPAARSCAVSSVKGLIGHSGAACGLTSLVRGALALYQEIIPPTPVETPVAELSGEGPLYLPRTPRYWLRNRADGPRRAGVSVFGIDGSCSHVVLEGCDEKRRELEVSAPAGRGTEALFTVTGDTEAEVVSALGRLRSFAREEAHADLTTLAAKWHRENGAKEQMKAAGLVARNREELEALLDQGERLVAAGGELDNSFCHPSLRDRVFYSARPIGRDGKVAFVFPGSGNHFPGMGLDISARWPEVFRRQDAENLYLARQFQAAKFWNGATTAELNEDHQAVIFGQVATGCVYSDLMATFGVRPEAVIGYSLGESAGLFATRTWRDRDAMLARMEHSTLFTRDLAGECRAAQRAWGAEGKEVEWSIGVVDVTVREVRRALRTTSQVYLLIVNTPEECVIGGNAKWVKHLVAMLGCRFFPLEGVTTVHCEVAQQVARAYRDLHLFPTTPPADITFYSGARGGRYDVSRDSAADSILAQAVGTIDFPRLVRAAYQDGVRHFVEMGPGGSCSRMIGRILRDQPHCARSVSLPGVDGNSALLRLLAQLVAERVPVDLEPLFADRRPAPVAVSEEKPRLLVKVATGGGAFSPELPGRASAPREARAQQAAEAVPVAAAPAVREVQQPVPLAAAAKSPAEILTPSPSVPRNEAVSVVAATSPAVAPAAPAPAPVVSSAVDLLFSGFAAAQEARMQAHAAYLSFADTLARCTEALAAGFPAAAEPAVSTAPAPQAPRECAYDRAMCLEFAIGSVSRMLGPEFAEVDSYPTRVRLPDEPLMLVDRIVSVEGEPRSMTRGKVVTEHDIHPGAWYLDGGRIPTCIAVEAGQADLFLSGYLGIDFITKGLAVYRLLDAVVTFHRELPRPGETIRYDIHIERFFRQGDTYLFRFHFEATVDGAPLLSMRDGCAGFFSEAELAAGKGIVHGAIDLRPRTGKLPADWTELVAMQQKESYSFEQLESLRKGDLAGCFGPLFAPLPLQRPLTIPSGRMQLVHRVMELVPRGGRYQLGYIRAEADIHPDDWFLTCHFVDDKVMPGTLMYECCLHTLRIFLLRMGWVSETDGCAWVPVPGVASRLCCRGQVLETTRVVAYEVNVRELGYGPEPYAIVDALMYADGRPIVEITSMSVRLSGSNREILTDLWRGKGGAAIATNVPPAEPHGFKPALYTKEQILAYSNGKPSEGFGDRYRIFDSGRKIARLPGPPFQFMDRVTSVTGEPWQMVAGAKVESQYLVPADAWYFAADRQPLMPFAVLLEAALQPCGWLAAYVGSALTSPTDISFRNLGGNAVQHRRVTPHSGILTAYATMTKVATSGGMIIQEFTLRVEDRDGVVYDGETMFGFFSKDALANQVGIRDAAHYQPSAQELERGESLPYPAAPPFPDTQLRMIDTVELFIADGGPKELGYLRGTKQVNPEEWFFKAHFYEDPVTPGSLGLESFLQLVRLAAVKRWGWQEGVNVALALGSRHRWVYRGQVVPTNGKVTVEAVITAVDDVNRIIVADGLLSVDGRPIYQMKDFAVQAG
ncbi:type I polyketide synthase [Geomonas sp. RF6]|uniref:polyketide synthase n=1 Tax=Geomonas sp. RF6 TaxID=2897342 RepID=UPI001E5EE4D8|nr:polyketide synthase [Geomonas sp. RF6]UFS70032.1 type I polyketide synthase [Geomonas sp. RF6]